MDLFQSIPLKLRVFYLNIGVLFFNINLSIIFNFRPFLIVMQAALHFSPNGRSLSRSS